MTLDVGFFGKFWIPGCFREVFRLVGTATVAGKATPAILPPTDLFTFWMLIALQTLPLLLSMIAEAAGSERISSSNTGPLLWAALGRPE